MAKDEVRVALLRAAEILSVALSLPEPAPGWVVKSLLDWLIGELRSLVDGL